MHTKAAVRTGLLTGALLTGLAAFGPVAHADDLDVDPSVARPGQTVTVAGGCKDTDRYVSISGAAQGKGVVNDGWFSVSVRVAKDRPGTYRVEAKCITSNYSQQGTVRVKQGGTDNDHDRQPHGWATTGGGGTQGPELPWTGMGMALVAGAAGIGGAALLRSRARGRA
ncbi:hypothetical protein [Actinomadura hibisca]|uniref:hypothetical protein n=1 Tax=Actinomadura hibisca TaxID=68565 RepID=UPI000830462C|nr:hypothetical protein [Actinomadura hibisca]